MKPLDIFILTRSWDVEGMVVVVQLGKKAAKPDTAVQDSFSMFVSLKPLDIFDKTWHLFLAMFVAI